MLRSLQIGLFAISARHADRRLRFRLVVPSVRGAQAPGLPRWATSLAVFLE